MASQNVLHPVEQFPVDEEEMGSLECLLSPPKLSNVEAVFENEVYTTEAHDLNKLSLQDLAQVDRVCAPVAYSPIIRMTIGESTGSISIVRSPLLFQ